jgi:hypothetical protein
MAVVRDVIRDDHRRQRPRFLDHAAAPCVCGGSFGMSRGTGRGRLRHAAKYCVTICTPARVEVADDRRRSRSRARSRSVEIAHVCDRRRLEVRHAADRRVLVRMRRERVVVDDLVQPSVRLVLDAHPPLFLDHLTLAAERRIVDAQRRHAIGFEPQRQRQVLRRQRLPEHRLVFGRVGVAAAADAGDDRRVRLGLDVLRALEHHVLEQMREAGAAGRSFFEPT